jgi:hypothetical protein
VTAEGKSASSQNSFKHGLRSKDPLSAITSLAVKPRLLARKRAEYAASFPPQTPHDELLLDRIALAECVLDALFWLQERAIQRGGLFYGICTAWPAARPLHLRMEREFRDLSRMLTARKDSPFAAPVLTVHERTQHEAPSSAPETHNKNCETNPPLAENKQRSSGSFHVTQAQQPVASGTESGYESRPNIDPTSPHPPCNIARNRTPAGIETV